MSLFFENVEHSELRSRAVNIDEEEDNSVEETRTEFKTKFEKEDRKCHKMFIFVGKSMADYIRLGVLEGLLCHRIGRIEDTTDPKKVNPIYQLPSGEESKGATFFTAVEGLLEKDFFNWTAELLTSLTSTSTKVVVLASVSSSSYIGQASLSSYTSAPGSSEDPQSFFRCVHTTEAGLHHDFTPLESPNFLAGLSAQVFLHCEAHKMKSVHFLMYSALCTPPSLLHQILCTLKFSTQNMSSAFLCKLESKMLQSRATSSMYT